MPIAVPGLVLKARQKVHFQILQNIEKRILELTIGFCQTKAAQIHRNMIFMNCS